MIFVVDLMVAERISPCNRQVPGADDSVSSQASVIAIAERPLAVVANSANGLCVPIFDALTVSG
jgi:hypothetical protein